MLINQEILIRWSFQAPWLEGLFFCLLGYTVVLGALRACPFAVSGGCSVRVVLWCLLFFPFPLFLFSLSF